jgi:hypothetical protein
MMRFFTQMLRFPLTVVVYTTEALVNAMRDIQRTVDQTINAVVGGVGQAPDNMAGVGSAPTDSHVGGGDICDNANRTTHKEERTMSDQDLSGDDLKYVSYSILFTKRDLEATLERETQDVVNYSTNGGSYGGLKIAHFMKRVLEGRVRRPEEWKSPGNIYPEGATGDYFTRIPPDDEKYITFIYRVDRRIPREGKEYDREQ